MVVHYFVLFTEREHSHFMNNEQQPQSFDVRILSSVLHNKTIFLMKKIGYYDYEFFHT